MQTQIKYEMNPNNFSKIPGSPIAYWVSKNIIAAFDFFQLSNYVDCKSGIMTGDEKFIEFWFEPSIKKINFDCKRDLDMNGYKWFPLNSGGNFRRWYGNLEKVVDLENNGENIKKTSKNYRLRDPQYYFRPGITWGRITSSKIAFRIVKDGTLFGDAGPIGFIDNEIEYVLSFLSSKIVDALLEFINPTLNYQVGDIMRLPLCINEVYKPMVNAVCLDNINLSKKDWDSFETSWDFKRHPLI